MVLIYGDDRLQWIIIVVLMVRHVNATAPASTFEEGLSRRRGPEQ